VNVGIEVESRDCTAVTDAELEELADLCSEGSNPYSIGLLSKQTEEWVLLAEARDNGKLKGYAFFTLERIGGTPCVLIGLSSIGRNSKRDTVLRALMTEHMRRALMAFPDEDVLVGTQFNDPSGFEAFKNLDGIRPHPTDRANGEERAWGRRLAKRFGIGVSSYEDRVFIARGGDDQARVLDHESSKPEKTDPAVTELFADVNIGDGDSLVAFGWAPADSLLKLGKV